MNMNWFKIKDRRNLLSAFVGGSLLVMVGTLTVSAAYFSQAFTRKEGQRAAISREQLSHFFTFHYSQMGEEMWTGNYEAIAMRIGVIAREMGNAKYEVAIADENAQCVFKGDAKVFSKGCDLSADFLKMIQTSGFGNSVKPSLRFADESKTYIYMVPLYVGSRLKGYLHAVLTDPYEFYRGSTLEVMASTLLPAMGFILTVWVLWLLACRRLFLKPYLKSLEEMKNNEALARLAGQTAHDMRDPLSWIDKLTASLPQIPEEKRVMIKSAVLQLKDIANGLLSHSRVFSPATKEVKAVDGTDIELLPSIVGRIVSEKRIQFKSRSNVEIESPLDTECYGMFARIQPNEFKRVLSNLINNAVDAVESKGQVTVKICSCKDYVIVRVIDNGKGIPADILPKLGALGATFGKKRGNGLGLYHAKTVVESWGGRIDIHSEIGKGTVVEIRLPSITPPEWFVPELQIPVQSLVAVLDDHPSVHQIWRERFEALKGGGVKLRHFTSAEDFIHWYEGHLHNHRISLLCDYELLGQTRTGLELIEELNLRNRAILVTSHYEDEEVRHGCLMLGVRLIPKELAPFVPMKIVDQELVSSLASIADARVSAHPGAL